MKKQNITLIDLPDGFRITADCHSFNVSLASAIGLTEAILIQNFYYWHQCNRENKSMCKDGKIWFFRSVSAICGMYPYLSSDKVRYAIERLVKSGFLIKGNYSEDKLNRSNWYALTDSCLKLFETTENSQKDWENTDPFGKIPNDSVKSQLNYNNKTIENKNIEDDIPPLPPAGECGDSGKNSDFSSFSSDGTDGYAANDGNSAKTPERKVAPKESVLKEREPWRVDFDEYMKLVNEGAAALKADAKFRADVERLQPNVDYDKTIEWCVSQYWGTEAAWETKRKSRSKRIDMKATLRQNFNKNRIYKEGQRTGGYRRQDRPRDVDTIHVDDDWADILKAQRERVEAEERRRTMTDGGH